MNLTNFLSAAMLREVEQDLHRLHAQGAAQVLGYWDRETGYACVIEVMAGAPIQWHLRGPVDRDGARFWLGIVQGEINVPSSPSLN